MPPGTGPESVERDLISVRTREGLAKASASGKKLGRSKGSLGVSRLDGKEDEIRQSRRFEWKEDVAWSRDSIALSIFASPLPSLIQPNITAFM